MSKISQILGASGPLITVRHNGKDYKARPLMQEVKAEWERWLEARAMRAIVGLKGLVSPAEYLSLIKEAAADVASVKYAFGGELSNAALATMTGGVAFAAIVFGVSEQEALELFEAKGEEIQAALQRLLIESSGTPGEDKEGDADPNG